MISLMRLFRRYNARRFDELMACYLIKPKRQLMKFASFYDNKRWYLILWKNLTRLLTKCVQDHSVLFWFLFFFNRHNLWSFLLDCLLMIDTILIVLVLHFGFNIIWTIFLNQYLNLFIKFFVIIEIYFKILMN